MLRDQEELLNSVYDYETKEYLREALQCYKSGSYRACIIMSVIAGSYDLHKKVKTLSDTDSDMKNLDENIEEKKSELKPYEKYLIENCATTKIDMLNNNDERELLRCLDIRNACAHPNDFICSAEKARDVFSSIIDIIASKPGLFGFKHMNVLMDELKQSHFFTNTNNDKRTIIISNKLNRFQSRAIKSLFKKICEKIKETTYEIEKDNCMIFLALSYEYIDHETKYLYSDFLRDFIDKDEYESILLELLGISPNIINSLSDYDIDRIINKFGNFVNNINNNSYYTWQNIMDTEKMLESRFLTRIIENVLEASYDNLNGELTKYTIIEHMLIKNSSNNFTSKIIDFIISLLNLNFEEIDSLKHKDLREELNNINFLNIIRDLNSTEVYNLWLKVITNNIKINNFYLANDSIKSLESIHVDEWFSQTDDKIKFELLKAALFISFGSTYNAYKCHAFMSNLDRDYPQLTQLFLEQMIINYEEDRYRLFYDDYHEIIKQYINNSKCIKSKIIDEIKQIRIKAPKPAKDYIDNLLLDLY